MHTNCSAKKTFVTRLISYYQRSQNYHILRPWSSANGFAAASTKSLIDTPQSEPVQLKNVVLFNKRTRYEFEKLLANRQTEEEFQNYMSFLGSDYKKLLDRHNQHYRELDVLLSFLKKQNVNVNVISRADFDSEALNSADAVITAGGDGTFLQAAGWVKSNSIPVIGFNTDPTRSQGHLCLPDMDIDDIFERLLSGRFRWLNRQRIEISVSTLERVHVTDLHAAGRPSWEYPVSSLPPDPDLPGFVCLPSLALNEVFIGETSNAITAYYEVTLDNSPPFKQKSSGLTVTTGTGSTSWYYTISSLHPDTVRALLQVANDTFQRSKFQTTTSAGSKNAENSAKSQGGLPVKDPAFIASVVHAYNSGIPFHPEERRLAFAARDPIVNEIYKLTMPRGYCSKIKIKSRMADGTLVIDGGIKYAFSMGAEVVLRVAPDAQALRTVSLFKPSSEKDSPSSKMT